MVIVMRDLTADERSILERIFAQLPNVEDELRAQSKSAKVITLDEEGSLRFVVPSSASASTKLDDRVPVTAIFDDADGIPVYILLHIQEGTLFELEIYKADGSKLIRTPVAGKLYF
jgi:hypothetical protein